MKLAGLLLAGALLVGSGLAGIGLGLDRLLPLDTTRYRESGHLVRDRQGEALRYLPARDGVWRLRITPEQGLEQVDSQYLALLLAYEDRRFHQHPGIDPLAAGRALLGNLQAGRIISGASTLTMQVARLLHPQPRGWQGKAMQAFRALQLEWHYSKAEILAMYLTLAPFGGNIEGVHMASRLYFGKEPHSLSLAESALLIALPQAPTLRRPLVNPAAALAGREQVLRRLAAARQIDAAALSMALAAPLPAKRHRLPFLAPHLTGAEAARQAAPAVIDTSLDAELQRRLEGLVRREAGWFADPASIAIVVDDLPGRNILAAIGGHDFAGRQGQVDMTRALRSPGSALKPFIYAQALDAGLIHPETVIDDRPTRFGSYLPRNFDRHFQGRVTIRDALQQSLNVPAVAVLERLGAGQFVTGLRQLGITLALPPGRDEAGLAVALGGAGISLRDLTALYAMLAGDGIYHPLRHAAAAPLGTGQMVLRPAAARQIGDILAEAPRPSGIQGSAHNPADRIAYKTGTSYGFRDAWAVGYTAQHVVGVWVGRPDGTPRPGAYGRNTAAPILFQAFDILGGRGSITTPLSAEAENAAPARLPPPALRSFARHQAGMGQAVTDHDGPRILFPPAQVELALPAAGKQQAGKAHGASGAVMLEARGALPLRWYVDGQPLTSDAAGSSQGRQVEWLPPGPGFFRISVVDAEGRSSSLRTRLVADEKS